MMHCFYHGEVKQYKLESPFMVEQVNIVMEKVEGMLLQIRAGPSMMAV